MGKDLFHAMQSITCTDDAIQVSKHRPSYYSGHICFQQQGSQHGVHSKGTKWMMPCIKRAHSPKKRYYVGTSQSHWEECYAGTKFTSDVECLCLLWNGEAPLASCWSAECELSMYSIYELNIY